ncbi:MAG: hypothetical protein EYX74_00700 [Desulfobulbaceae bacterium]|nr:MAG: hypothetical protein EYX74_00700 [Desulfobulbaceae bacterium]
MKYLVVAEETKTGFSAYSPDLAGKLSKNPSSRLTSQRGIVALLLILILFIGGMSMLFMAGGMGQTQRTEQAATTRALAQAKELVIAFAVTNTHAFLLAGSPPTLKNRSTPGGLPFPDRGRFDGHGDCISDYLTFDPTRHLLGKWPHLSERGCGTIPHPPHPPRWPPAFGTPLRDGSGAVLWYAVARHLVKSSEPGRDSQYSIINTETIAATPNNVWFSVFNEQGDKLTNRAAVVIMAPGPPLAGQNRIGSAPASTHFLEGITIANTTYTHHVIEDPDSGFVMRRSDDEFNDRLIYITIDELMTAVAIRVAGEMKKALDAYHVNQTPPQYPANRTGFKVAINNYIAGNQGNRAWLAANDWVAITTYERTNLNVATLRFADCQILFTLTPGQKIEHAPKSCK